MTEDKLMKTVELNAIGMLAWLKAAHTAGCFGDRALKALTQRLVDESDYLREPVLVEVAG